MLKTVNNLYSIIFNFKYSKEIKLRFKYIILRNDFIHNQVPHKGGSERPMVLESGFCVNV